jgi:uncharacterized RDD family membrane protein YckC
MSEQQSSILEPPDPNQTGPWRDEVQARLQRYKTRRGRRIEGAFTMRFPFPPQEESTAAVVTLDVAQPESSHETETPQTVSSVQAGSAPQEEEPAPLLPERSELDDEASAFGVQSSPASSQPEFELEVKPTQEFTPFVPTPRPRPRRKVIAFPQPAYSSMEERHRLADPVSSEQLRILEVPEELEAVSATPFLDGVLEPAKNSAAPAPPAIELPCLAANGWKRMQAALLDFCLLVVGAAIFAGSAYRFLPSSMPVKFALVAVGAVCVLLWAVYQYLFLVYSGGTLGMRAAGVRLSSFKGAAPGIRQRRLRVLSLYLSVLSMGMGVLWYFVDVDSLCWHDRMSQTFPAPAK